VTGVRLTMPSWPRGRRTLPGQAAAARQVEQLPQHHESAGRPSARGFGHSKLI